MSSISDVDDLLLMFNRLKSDRSSWEDHWQRLAELMLPKRADFTGSRTPGERRTEEQYDGTPMQAARNLASAIDGMLKPKTTRWFRIQVNDPDLQDDDEAKAWLQEVEDRMYSAIYNRKSRFIQSTGEVDLDLVVFGTGILFVDVTKDLDSLLFQHIPLKNCYFVRNSDGIVDMIFFSWELTARQAFGKFGNKSPTAMEALDRNGRPDQKVKFLHVVMPRDERDFRIRRSDNLPVASIWIDIDAKEIVRNSGFDEFPFMVPTWDSAEGENYGRSPGMLALPDANMANAQAQTLIQAGQKAVNPPLLIASDSVIGAARLTPGGQTYFDTQVAQALGRVPIQPLETGANLPLGREMLNDTREMVWAAFFRNILQLPIDRPEMTATEILERKEEFQRLAGPVFGRLETDYIGPLVDRVYNIMARNGSFPEAPDFLQGTELRFEYESPIEKARRQTEAAGSIRSLELLAPYAANQPQILDNFNFDQIARDVGESHGMRPSWFRDLEDVAAERQQRAEAAQQQQQLQQLDQGVNTAANLAKGLPDGVVEGLIGGNTG